MKTVNLSFAIIVFLMACGSLSAAPQKDEWAKGIPFHTKWDDAIKEAKATGKMIFIYNGWQNKGI